MTPNSLALLMTESSMPAWVAAVTVPRRKLYIQCILNTLGMPACVSACLTAETSLSQVRGLLFLNMNRGPSDSSHVGWLTQLLSDPQNGYSMHEWVCYTLLEVVSEHSRVGMLHLGGIWSVTCQHWDLTRQWTLSPGFQLEGTTMLLYCGGTREWLVSCVVLLSLASAWYLWKHIQ